MSLDENRQTLECQQAKEKQDQEKGVLSQPPRVMQVPAAPCERPDEHQHPQPYRNHEHDDPEQQHLSGELAYQPGNTGRCLVGQFEADLFPGIGLREKREKQPVVDGMAGLVR